METELNETLGCKRERESPYKNFNAIKNGHGSQLGEQQNRGDGRRQLQCWICGKEHLQKDFSLYQGGIPQIYSAKEAQIVVDVGQSIPQIYATLDNIQEDHQESIIEMDGKLYDQFVSIFIDLGSNYSYVDSNMVDKFGLGKEVHTESWLVQLSNGTKKRVHNWVTPCEFELDDMPTSTHLSVLPLGSQQFRSQGVKIQDP